jgi:hypothetical protein
MQKYISIVIGYLHLCSDGKFVSFVNTFFKHRDPRVSRNLQSTKQVPSKFEI